MKELSQKILKPIKEEKGNFRVLFTALSVILLAFFVLLNAMATTDEAKVAQAVKSIRGSFGVLPANLQWLMGSAPRLPIDVGILAIPELEVHTLSREFENFIMDQEMGKDFGLFSSKRGTTILLSEKVGFRGGSAELETPMFPVLEKLASVIKQSGRYVHIEGHTDNVPISTPQYRSNWELSSARAFSILNYLVKTGEVRPSQIAAAGFGDSRPRFASDNPLDRSRNRRVEIIILNNEKDF